MHLFNTDDDPITLEELDATHLEHWPKLYANVTEEVEAYLKNIIPCPPPNSPPPDYRKLPLGSAANRWFPKSFTEYKEPSLQEQTWEDIGTRSGKEIPLEAFVKGGKLVVPAENCAVCAGYRWGQKAFAPYPYQVK
ncbi:uncharacterized protein IL334_000145 [Kwoniella shivajii]|uniref:Uncharacterized protein n=1 Tax=Kwoniella shivajii TaxID=564305 RepID=A0ABZ1CPG1_9TREE|nr:hypothetical protein IL334_000145 [Kwoniella shivajii]